MSKEKRLDEILNKVCDGDFIDIENIGQIEQAKAELTKLIDEETTKAGVRQLKGLRRSLKKNDYFYRVDDCIWGLDQRLDKLNRTQRKRE